MQHERAPRIGLCPEELSPIPATAVKWDLTLLPPNGVVYSNFIPYQTPYIISQNWAGMFLLLHCKVYNYLQKVFELDGEVILHHSEFFPLLMYCKTWKRETPYFNEPSTFFHPYLSELLTPLESISDQSRSKS